MNAARKKRTKEVTETESPLVQLIVPVTDVKVGTKLFLTPGTPPVDVIQIDPVYDIPRVGTPQLSTTELVVRVATQPTPTLHLITGSVWITP